MIGAIAQAAPAIAAPAAAAGNQARVTEECGAHFGRRLFLSYRGMTGKVIEGAADGWRHEQHPFEELVPRPVLGEIVKHVGHVPTTLHARRIVLQPRSVTERSASWQDRTLPLVRGLGDRPSRLLREPRDQSAQLRLTRFHDSLVHRPRPNVRGCHRR